MPTDDVKALSEEELAELERLEREATRGEWALDESGTWRSFPPGERGLWIGEFDGSAFDERLALAARNALPALLASARRCASLESRVAELEAENERLRGQARWRPVGEEPTRDEESILVAEPGERVRLAVYVHETREFWSLSGALLDPTHWRPLPKAPATSKEGE